jgi:hypothetical protein
MPYRIEEVDSIFEVRVWDPTSALEVLHAITELARRDPRKERCDLWSFDTNLFLSLTEYPGMVRETASLCGKDFVGNRSAILVYKGLQEAVAEMYQSEAAGKLPFEIGVFTSREDAIRWLKDGARST